MTDRLSPEAESALRRVATRKDAPSIRVLLAEIDALRGDLKQARQAANGMHPWYPGRGLHGRPPASDGWVPGMEVPE